jgi:hypothetical protein
MPKYFVSAFRAHSDSRGKSVVAGEPFSDLSAALAYCSDKLVRSRRADVRIPWKAFVRDGTLCQLTIINPFHDRTVPDEEFVWLSEFVCFADGISIVFIEHEELFWGASRPRQ